MYYQYKKIYPNHDFYEGYTDADIYESCLFVGVDFSKIRKPIIFRVCDFYYCTFNESFSKLFSCCDFNHCEFKGTFQAQLHENFFDDNTPYMPTACPLEGDFIGWKVCRDPDDHKPYLVKLVIPADARRTSGFGSRKCRCDRVNVLNILNMDGSQVRKAVVVSFWDSTFQYRKGAWIQVKNYDGDRRYTCAPGIHFFMERQEAINYYESEWK